MTNSRIGGTAAAITLFLLVLAPVQGADPPGDLWETTSQMVMEGSPMSMPPRTVKFCAAREWNQPPPGGDKSCVSSNYVRTGNKVTWTMQCGGQMPMTGEGEITFQGSDSYSGEIKAKADGMAMKIVLSGRKVGTCDNPQ